MSQNDHHIVPFSTYRNIAVALLAMTVITVGASRVDFGIMNTVIAMIIATIKASLVLAYFMHLKYDNLMNRVIFGTGIFFLAVLLSTCLTDIFTRYSQIPQ